MIDFHSHILPEMDDGADSVETSLELLRESRRQGVTVMFATPHFYADEEDPETFLERREEAWNNLRGEMDPAEEWPQIRLGAEILFFPGISVAEELRNLTLEGTDLLLIEPPMIPWSSAMLEEIEECGENLHRIPVIAHVDRYMRIFSDDTLLDRVAEYRMLAQVNASFFLYEDSREMAMDCLTEGRFHFLGSDCHDMDRRRPNLGYAAEVIHAFGGEELFRRFNAREARALPGR